MVACRLLKIVIEFWKYNQGSFTNSCKQVHEYQLKVTIVFKCTLQNLDMSIYECVLVFIQFNHSGVHKPFIKGSVGPLVFFYHTYRQKYIKLKKMFSIYYTYLYNFLF